MAVNVLISNCLLVEYNCVVVISVTYHIYERVYQVVPLTSW